MRRCYFDLILHSERWIVVNLQTSVLGFPVIGLFVLRFVFAALAAAAASPAEGHAGGDHSVPGFEGAQRRGQEVPAAEEWRQEPRAAFLHDVHQHHNDGKDQQGHSNPHQHRPARDGEAQDRQREEEKAQEEIQRCEPAVLGRAVAQSFGQSDGDAREGDGIPQQDPADVEEEVTERNLEKNTNDLTI